MPPYVMLNCRIHLGGYDLSGQMNSVTLQHNAEMLDDTVFTTGQTRSNAPGLKTVEINGSIFWEPALPAAPETIAYDRYLFERIGAVREVVSISPELPVVGGRIFSNRAVSGQYNPLRGEVGQLISSDLAIRSSNTPLLQAVTLAYGHKAATGNGAGVNLGAVTIAKKVYSAVHVYGYDDTVAPTIDVTIESAPADTFLAPTTRLTHTQIGKARGAGWQELAGSTVDPVNGITDTWWRAVWTLGGVAAAYDILVTLAIL